MVAVDHRLTHLLQKVAEGDADARDALWALVIPEIRALAAHAFKHGGAGAQFEPSVLVSEVYLKLKGGAAQQWESRKHFFGSVVRALDQLLIEHARTKHAQKRGVGAMQQSLDLLVSGVGGSSEDATRDDDRTLWMLEGLSELEAEAPEAADAFRLRILFGLNNDETAAALELSAQSVSRRLRLAHAFFADRLKRDRGKLDGSDGVAA